MSTICFENSKQCVHTYSAFTPPHFSLYGAPPSPPNVLWNN